MSPFQSVHTLNSNTLLHPRFSVISIRIDNILGHWVVVVGSVPIPAQTLADRLHDEDIVVQTHSEDEGHEAENLQAVEGLPAEIQRGGPHHKSAHRVKYHPGSGRQLLRDSNAGEIEERNRDDRASDGQHQLPVVGDLDEGVDGVLQCSGRIIIEGWTNLHEVHRYQEDRENREAKHSLPADRLQRGNIQTRHEMLFVNHLNGRYDLRYDDEQVSSDNVVSVWQRIREIRISVKLKTSQNSNLTL